MVLAVNSIPAQDDKSAELTLNRNPEKAEIVTSDLALFWRAYDMAKPENNLIVYRDEYFINQVKIDRLNLNEARAKASPSGCIFTRFSPIGKIM